MKARARWAAVVVLILTAGTLAAQTYHGGLRGAVRDSGGVVPGVSVVLVNDATGTGRTAVTNDAGEYAFASVEPATYTVRVTMSGYKGIEHKLLRVGTQHFVTLDFTLEVGLQESITVEGESSALETTTASVGSTLDKTTLETLPTAGRNPFFLSVTTANVVPSGDPQFVRQQDQTNSSLLSLGGGPRRANNYTLDGVSIVDLRNRPSFIPSIEAVEEVKVQVSTYDAEMGRTGGGVFNTTGRSGSNVWHGSALYQNRPQFGQGRLYFSRDLPKPDNYFHLYGASLGGPLIKGRTFFWATTEGYRTQTSRSAVVTAPTARELSGDFSQSGITVYDPLTTRAAPGGGFVRDPFPRNVIPADRISPVARSLASYWPQSGASTAQLKDKADQLTLKADHRWGSSAHTSAMYAWYDSQEPEARFYGGDNPADPGEGALFRTVHVLTMNTTVTPDSSTALQLRAGYTAFRDDDVPAGFDVASLGFSPNFVAQTAYDKFPDLDVGAYGTPNFDTFGDRDPTDTDYYAWEVNASVSKLWGRHTVKAGASVRQIGMKLLAYGKPAGYFSFDGQFTRGPNPLSAQSGDAHALAALLLGYPTSGRMVVATPSDFSLDYYAGFIQDDWRVGSKLTLNAGLRYEYERGLGEQSNALTVGFDRDAPWPVQVPGLDLRGGLMYAGVDGYGTRQGDPSRTKFAPRAGFAWTPDDRTVVRGGYGIFYAPHQYAFPNEQRLGTRGFTAITDYVASTDGGLTPCATCSLANPFPAAVQQPQGSAQGLLTGAGGRVDFVDQFRESAYVHQFSADLQRELGPAVVVGLGYVGARTENLTLGGTNSNPSNINQLDPRYLALGTALLDQVPNPFFGDPRFGAFGAQRTIPRGQLLRPYPQFGDLMAHQVSGGKARYHSVVLRLERRIQGGWGGRINYTWSANKDNIFGETNYFSNNTVLPLDNYDAETEYSDALLQTPHRINVAATVELPFGRGKRWLSAPGLTRTLLGGWSVSVVGAYQSGFPSQIYQNTNNSGLFGSGQRPNLVAGADPATGGGTEDRLNGWFNSAAWTPAPAFTFGDAPRTDTRVRSPFKSNTDIALQKVEPIGGGRSVMLRAELINAFDQPNFLGPNTAFGSSTFGRITQVGGFPRTLQLMARFSF